MYQNLIVLVLLALNLNSQKRYPATVLNLDNWKITIPLDTDHNGSPDEYRSSELDRFQHDTFFHLNVSGDAVVFRAHAGGITTSGSGYPRSELREMTADGFRPASWSSSKGKHTLFIDQRVTHLPKVKDHIVVGQIHDAYDDVIVFRLEGKKLFIDLNGVKGPVLDLNYKLGTRFNVKLEVSDNVTKCFYNGELRYTYCKEFNNAFFKAGAYVQSSCKGRKKVEGESCDAYGEVEIYNVWVKHQ